MKKVSLPGKRTSQAGVLLALFVVLLLPTIPLGGVSSGVEAPTTVGEKDDGKRGDPDPGALTQFDDYLYQSEVADVDEYALYNFTVNPGTVFTDQDDTEVYTKGVDISYTNLTVENVRAENYTEDIELLNNDVMGGNANHNLTFYQEFFAPADCYVNDISFYEQCFVDWWAAPLADRAWNVTVYNATYSPIYGTAVPDRPVEGLWAVGDPYDELGYNITSHWENFSLAHKRIPLRLADTYNVNGMGVFFAAAQLPKSEGHILYIAGDDYGDERDAGSCFLSYKYTDQSGTFQQLEPIGTFPDGSYDISTRITYCPVSYPETKPEDIKLTVDGTLVNNTPGQPANGTYSSFDLKEASEGSVRYNVESAWSDRFPGTLSYQVFLEYTNKELVTGDNKFSVNTSKNKVEWDLRVSHTYPDGIDANSSRLLYCLPLDWIVVGVNNVSGSQPVNYPFWSLETSGSTQYLTIENTTSGTWQVLAESPIYDLSVVGNATRQDGKYALNITDNFTTTGNASEGKNGNLATLDTKDEGKVDAVSTSPGYSSGTWSSLLDSDDDYVFFSQKQTGVDDYQALYAVNTSFKDLGDVLPEYINGIDVDIEHWRDPLVKGEENIDDINSSYSGWDLGLPFTNINKTEDFDRDRCYINVNFTAGASGGYGSSVYYNVTANSSGAVHWDNITDVVLLVVDNLTTNASFAQDFWLYNWSSGNYENVTSNIWKMQNGVPIDPQPYTAPSYFYWSSAGTGLNVSDFFRNVTVGNTVYHNQMRVKLELYCTASWNRTLPVGFDFIYTNYDFKYPLEFENYTLQFYNYSTGQYDDLEYNLTRPTGTSDVVDSFHFGSLNWSDVFNYTTGYLSLRVNFSGHGASRLSRLDQVRLRLNYTAFFTYKWNSSLVSSADAVVKSEVKTTFQDSSWNNFTFSWLLSDATKTPGNFTFVTAWMNGTVVALNTTEIVIRGIDTSMQLESGYRLDNGDLFADPSPYVNDTTRVIELRLTDDIFHENLTGATIKAVNWPTGDLQFSEPYRLSGNDADKGLYKVWVNTTGLDESSGGYTLNLSATIEAYLPTWINLTVQVLPLPTSLVLSNDSVSVYEGQNFEFSALLSDEFHGQSVAGATVTWSLSTGGLTGSLTNVLSVYSGSVDLASAQAPIPAGNYTVTVTASKSNFATAVATISLNVLPKENTTLTLETSGLFDRMVENTVLVVRATLANQPGGGLSGKEVVFTFNMSSAQGGQLVTKRAVSDANGVAEVQFQVPEGTQTLSVYAAYEGEVSINGATSATSQVFTILSIEEVRREMFTKIAIYLAVAVAVLSLFLVVKRQRHAKKARVWVQNSQRLADSMKIQHVLVLYEGTPIVSRSFGDTELDGSLIGGFLQALTSFGREITIKKSAPKSRDVEQKQGTGYLFDYESFKVLMMDGRYVRVALILDSPPTDFIRSQLRAFVEAFETGYERQITEFSGRMADFEGVAEVIEKVFGIDLMFPHQLSAGIEKNKLPKLQRAIYEIAEAISKERPCFFVASLLEYAIAGRKEPREQILSAIFDLREAKVIVPVKME
ncbi:MAG: COG1470 family protein [Promethearchaeota archaeon]